MPTRQRWWPKRSLSSRWRLDEATRARGEAYLLRHAVVHHAGALAQLADHLLEVLAPDLAEARLAEALAREEDRAARTSLTAADDRHGMIAVRGRFPVEDWALVAAALDPLATPHPTSPAPHGQIVGGHEGSDAAQPGVTAVGEHVFTAPGLDSYLATGGTEHDPATGQDTRPFPRRMADALVELSRRALHAGDLPTAGGVRPHVTLTIDADWLAARVGAGLLDTGHALAVDTVRRFACDAAVSTMLVDRTGQPLDVGRAQRLFPAPIRCALTQRDRGCAFPGCTRPPAWADAHHIVFWADGGPTSLDNGVLLCGHHHRLIHIHATRDDGWRIKGVPGGRPVFIPPESLDPKRRPRRNPVHLRL